MRAAFTALLALCLGVAIAFLAIPIIALFTEVPLGDVPGLLRDPAVQDTLKVTARTNAIANVASLTSKVALGSADAGFAYNTDARAAGDRVAVIRLPTEAQPKIQYLLCAVRREGANTEAAQAFIDSIVSEDGRRALQQQGFGPPPGT